MGIYTEFVTETESVFVAGDGHYDLEVVGAPRLQKYLKILNKRCLKNDGQQELIAKLHYENVNPYDNKAIRVVINGGLVGYLLPGDARLFRKRLERLGQEGTITACNAIITGGRRTWNLKQTDFEVWLDLTLSKL